MKRFSTASWILVAAFTVAACAQAGTGASGSQTDSSTSPVASSGARTAIFAGGCFWCMEHPFDQLDGVQEVTVGYTGGHTKNPTYEEVSSGSTGHAEAVEVVYDPERISYQKLLDVFWHNVDPIAEGHQFCDWGDQYRAEIFYTTPEQKQEAEASKSKLQSSGRFKKPITTKIVAAGPFYPAEEYHQEYYKKNPIRYRIYRTGCGRDRRLHELWGDEAPQD